MRPLSFTQAVAQSRNVTRFSNCGVRSISQSAIVNAKKKGKASDPDDMFGEGFSGHDDLFGTAMKASKATKASSKSASTVKTKTASSVVQTSASAEGSETASKAASDERLARFNKLYQFVAERIDKEPIKTPIQVRSSAWTHLLGLANTKHQLERVVQLFPLWRDAGKAWTPQIAEDFVRRCEELGSPQLALQVFTDHPKYGLDLATLPAARRLLHSLHVEHPLADSITVSALYKIYNLPPISSDLVSCAMLASACFKHNTPESVAVANELVPSLRALLERTPPQGMTLPVKEDKAARARTEAKEKAWLAWTLGKIEKALAKQGEDFAWLRQWRI
ncbi:hypothetical protein EUX98_g2758 [Antrodiella citrinella]|uniref:Uncharacterized protein n=1 Tax=Antrodiella citrinella TaxID=2447956 RepID=A0A4S4MY59_9APHY|nr:hypothetical protein EUX98_g2758 [Antrodiella citrinella]